MPNWKLTLSLTGIFVLLALYVLLVEMKKPQPLGGEDKTAVIWTLDDAEKKAFRRLVVTDGPQQAVFSRELSGDWSMLEPKTLRLDFNRVDYAVNNVRDLHAEQIVQEKDARLADYGLDKPSFRISLQDKDKKVLHELLGGSMSPTRSGYYVQQAGQAPVYLVATWRLDDVKKLVTAPPTPTPSPPPTPKPKPTPPLTPMPAVRGKPRPDTAPGAYGVQGSATVKASGHP